MLSALLMNSSHIELEVEFRVVSSNSLPVYIPSRRALLLLPSKTFTGERKTEELKPSLSKSCCCCLFFSRYHTHFKHVVLLQPEVPCSKLDAFARLGLDGVDALVIVTIVARVVGR